MWYSPAIAIRHCRCSLILDLSNSSFCGRFPIERNVAVLAHGDIHAAARSPGMGKLELSSAAREIIERNNHLLHEYLAENPFSARIQRDLEQPTCDRPREGAGRVHLRPSCVHNGSTGRSGKASRGYQRESDLVLWRLLAKRISRGRCLERSGRVPCARSR